MSIQPNTRICTHIKVNGIRCGSPALRGEVFCYFHQRMIRGVRTPPRSRLHPMAILDDAHSIQAALMETVNAIVRNQIDVARARLILRALQIAVKNVSRVHFDWSKGDMVKAVPEYPAAPPAAGPFTDALAQAEALAHVDTPREVKKKAAQQEEAREKEAFIQRFHEAYGAPEAAPRKPPTRARRARNPTHRRRSG